MNILYVPQFWYSHGWAASREEEKQTGHSFASPMYSTIQTVGPPSIKLWWPQIATSQPIFNTQNYWAGWYCRPAWEGPRKFHRIFNSSLSGCNLRPAGKYEILKIGPAMYSGPPVIQKCKYSFKTFADISAALSATRPRTAIMCFLGEKYQISILTNCNRIRS